MPQGTLESLTTAGAGSFEANGRVSTKSLLTITSTGNGFTSILDAVSNAAILRSTGHVPFPSPTELLNQRLSYRHHTIIQYNSSRSCSVKP